MNMFVKSSALVAAAVAPAAVAIAAAVPATASTSPPLQTKPGPFAFGEQLKAASVAARKLKPSNQLTRGRLSRDVLASSPE
jgi:hypothetical protein